jgi:hypothetical protein
MTDDELNELRQFHAEVEEYVRNNPIDPKREAAEDAESLKLQAQFPGEFVAYLDTWDGQTLTRKVIAHARRHREIGPALEQLSEAEREVVSVVYIDPPNVALCTRVQTGEIRARQDAPRG